MLFVEVLDFCLVLCLVFGVYVDEVGGLDNVGIDEVWVYCGDFD